MRTYTLHLPPDADRGDARALERADLVRDGFSWPAFLFTAFWFFWHRLWLTGLAVLAGLVAFGILLRVLGVGAAAAFWAQLLLHILVGLEAATLRRWALTRRGRPAVDLVMGADRDEAETKAFSRWLESTTRSRAAPPVVSAPVAPYRMGEPVIGLFPDAARTK